MDEIRFADGFDAPDRLAFGLGAGQLVTVVAGGAIAYALLRAPLPGLVAAPAAFTAVCSAAALGWLHLAGRSAFDWAVFAVRFVARPSSGVFEVTLPRKVAPERSVAPSSVQESVQQTPASNVIDLRARGIGDRHAQARIAVRGAGAPSAGRGPIRGTTHASSSDRPGLRIGGAHRITFFSLKGGAGRTTLAVELACALAATHRGRREPQGSLSVALLDLDLRCGSVAVRLGLNHSGLLEFALAPPDERRVRDFLTPHASGAHVLVGSPNLTNPDWPVTAPLLREILRELDLDGMDVVVMDVSPELNGVTRAALSSSDDVFVVVVPTASGVQDAYRTTEQLRHIGLRHQLRYVVNRARPGVDVGETIADLAGQLVAEIPDDPVLADAENTHRVAALCDRGDGARAVQRLSRRIRNELAFSCAP